MTDQTAPGIRERNRVAITEAILTVARSQLGQGGAASLSLRAIARDLDMASSAIYRYFPSRDALLTRLIVDAYSSLADHVAAHEAQVPRADLAARLKAIGRAVRSWALANEHEYALIYGTPVPGYRAPQDTIGPATRVTELLVALLVEAVQTGRVAELPTPSPADEQSVEPVLATIAAIAGTEPDSGAAIPPELMIRGLMAWTLIFGSVSFELFGHVHNVVTSEREAHSPFFEAELDRLVHLLGLAGAITSGTSASRSGAVG